MVDIVNEGTLLDKTADTTVGTDGGSTTFVSATFRPRNKAGLTNVFFYSSVNIAKGGVALKVKDPSGTFRTLLSSSPALTGGNTDYIYADIPLGEARVDVTPNVTAATSKDIRVWFVSA